MHDLKEFEKWLILQGRSPRTVEEHLKTIRLLLREIGELTRENVENYLIKRKQAGLKGKTLNKYIGTIHMFSRCFELQNLDKMKWFREEPVTKATLTDDEIKKILECVPPKGSYSKEWDTWTLFFTWLAFTGCRPSEVATLTKKDIDLDKRVFYIRNSKTFRARTVPIPEQLIGIVKKYLDNLKGEKLFVTSRDKTFTDHAWIRRFDRRCEIAGVEKKGRSLYSLRHSLITRLLSQDIAVAKIAKLAGNSPDIIHSTYEHLVVDDLFNAMSKDRLGHSPDSSKDDLNTVIDNLMRELIKLKKLI